MRKVLWTLAWSAGWLALGLLVVFLVGLVLYATLWGFGSGRVLIAISALLCIALMAAISAAALGKIGSRSLAAFALVVSPSILLLGTFWLETLQRKPDTSCHNPLRDGSRQIAAVQSFSFEVPSSQWSRLEGRLRSLQSARKLQGRYDVRQSADFKWLQISLCRDDGTLIQITGSPLDDQINVALFAPQGGNDWRDDYLAVRGLIDSEWPGSMRDEGQETSIRNTL